MPRCAWCTDQPLYIHYHDTEWGRPCFDPQALFELLCLEGLQAGLSWWVVLSRREALRTAFNRFIPERVVGMSDAELDALLGDPRLIRHRAKLYSVRSNAKAWLRQPEPVAWLWSFVGGAPRINIFTAQQVPTQTPQSEAMSRALRKAGFSFVGPVICYAFMQASGMVMDHTLNCDLHGVLAGDA